ncbi:PleD family two-component system response regulator [Terrihabitans rhizophilus]|uniref:diguanylate cyclase n=1 Tax=Terrihabitans rhizophilus TaxID=3092662 RepID=A0ABU4RQW4_9HYPH|nr:PleD family two-component system response regulator [Terrihabitans sp. PJ23]MDX6805171.1 PleD family two-component system response regulator [Terrihabitans sp. PJ23]
MPARILVVDDVLPNVRLLEARLTAEYFEVVTAMSGQEALDACARSAFDLVLLDVMMPGMDGFEVCRRLKADPSTCYIPVVIITALDQAVDKVAGLEAGADDFLTKPVSELALMARVRSLTRIKQMTDELRMRAKSGLQIGLSNSVLDAVLDDGLGGRILIVDDRASSYERMQLALSINHHVEVETSPQEALFRSAEGAYDLVIVSLSLQGFDALRLCSQMRSLERTRHLPILAVVEPDDNLRVMRGLDLGINDFLSRPVDRNELVARTLTQIRRHRYTQRLRSKYQMSLQWAVTDPLTGMHNRRYMETHLETLLDQDQDRPRPLSVIMVDIDHFKSINDRYGHDRGDDVLRGFGERVRQSVRSVDLACRYGGEEFIILMPDADIGVAQAVGERLRRRMESEPFGDGADEPISVTISVGITASQPNDSPAAIMKRADLALYRAKSDGRNRVVSDAA